MYEQRACFFAWLIMPFNSRSTMPLHRIISQWSWLFLLSHALTPFFLIAKWIMDPTVCTRGRAASWRMGWPIMSIRGRHTDGGSLLLCTALIKLEDNYRFGLKKIKRWSVRRQNNQLHPCLSICFPLSLVKLNLFAPLCPSSSSNQTGQCVFIWVGGWVSLPFIICQLGSWLLFYSHAGQPSLSLLTVPG